MGTLKLSSDYYPARLHKAFILNPTSLFPYLWKGARPFTELWPATTLISSTTIEEDDDPTTLSSSSIVNRSATGSVSSRFSFTVSGHDSLKPWYLNTVAEPSPSLIGLSPQTARSYSFASPSVRSTPIKTPHRGAPPTPRPSFLASPAAALFSMKKEGQQGKEVMFLPYLRLYRRPYDEMVYRGRMKPPLGGLVSIVAPQQQGKHIAQQPQMLRGRVGTNHQQRF